VVALKYKTGPHDKRRDTIGNAPLDLDCQLTAPAPPPDLDDQLTSTLIPEHPDTAPGGTGRVDDTIDIPTNNDAVDITTRGRPLSQFLPAWQEAYGHTSSSDSDDDGIAEL
jgi:hypothetical protein